MTVLTRAYERVHGKSPRGFGNWAFFPGSDTSDVMKARFYFGKYSDVVKQAKADAKALGFDSVTVGA